MANKLITFATASSNPNYECALLRTRPLALRTLDAGLKGFVGQFVLTDCVTANVNPLRDSERPLVRQFRAGVLIGEDVMFEVAHGALSDARLPTGAHVVWLSADSESWRPPSNNSHKLELVKRAIDEWKNGSPSDVTNDFRFAERRERLSDPDSAYERVFVGDGRVREWLGHNVPGAIFEKCLAFLEGQRKKGIRAKKRTA